jgi:hypothetical protein
MPEISSASPFSEIAKALKQKDPAVWGAQTEEGLSAIKARCDAHWTVTTPFLPSKKLLWVAVGGVTLPLVAVFNIIRLGSHLTTAVVLTVIGLILISGVAATVLLGAVMGVKNIFGMSLAELLSIELELMSKNPHLCSQALDLVNRSEGARAYRDQVISKGRQLRVGDYDCLLAQLSLDRERDQHAQCQELHGLTRSA